MSRITTGPMVANPTIGAAASGAHAKLHRHHPVSPQPPPLAIERPMRPIDRLAALSAGPDGIGFVATAAALLAHSPGSEPVSVGACLRDICDDLARDFDRPNTPSLSCTVVDECLPVGTVIILGLITDLLISNAWACGFPPPEGGRIAVSFSRREAVFDLAIDDSGRVGPATTGRRSDALTIADLLVGELGGWLETPSVIAGSRCIITIPRHKKNAAG